MYRSSSAPSRPSPKTPTEGAWLAFLQDDEEDKPDDGPPPSRPFADEAQSDGDEGDDDDDHQHDPSPSPSGSSNPQRLFWERLMNADPNGIPQGSCEEAAAAQDSPATKQRKPRRKKSHKPPRMSKRKSQPQPQQPQQQKYPQYASAPRVEEPSSFFDLLRCGSIDTNVFMKMEEELNAGIEIIADKVESPCKMMRPPDSYKHHSNGMNPSASDDSGILDNKPSDLLSELKEVIPSLQKRKQSEFKGSSINSKYKDLLGAAPQVDPPMEVQFLDVIGLVPSQEEEEEEEKFISDEEIEILEPLSPRRDFSENTSHAPKGFGRSSTLPNKIFSQSKLHETPTSLPNKIFSESQLQETPSISRTAATTPRSSGESPSPAKTAKTGNLTELSDFEDPTDENRPTTPSNKYTRKKLKDRVPVETVEAPATAFGEATEAIMKGISSLTTEGEFQTRTCHQVQHHRNLVGPSCVDGASAASKTCMPPLLMKKFQALKNIKLVVARSSSTSQQSHSSSCYVIPKDRFADYAAGDGDGQFIYEYETDNHAYVAFFRRGTTASHSIRLYEHPVPPVFPTLNNELVVRIEASTVSSTDCQVRRGDFWGESSDNALNLPIVPGVAFAGTVHQLSMPKSGFRTGLKWGDRVISLVQVGANSRYLCISSDRLVKVPDDISDPCAVACIPEIYLTAFQSLHYGQKTGLARYRKTSLSGKTILVLGGATVIGRALIELATAAGCEKVYATGKEKQFDAIRGCGGAPLGRDPHQWSSVLANKVDIVVGNDNTVGTSELREEHMHLLARNGRVVVLCAPNDNRQTVVDLDELAEMTANTGRKMIHFNVFDAWELDLKQGKRDLTHLLKLLRDGLIRPKILECIPLNRIAKAQDLLEGKKMNGFVLCEPWILGRKKNEVLSGTNGEVYAESASKSTTSPQKQVHEAATTSDGLTAATTDADENAIEST